ncbi:MAG: hypothetical protein HYX96_05495 [Chloroflexi bacterium]|nr:hypothetical protein [Chloroflexota bacterium]
MNTMTCASIEQNPLNFPRNLGVSEDADVIQRETDELKQSFAQTVTFGEHLSTITEGLLQVRKEYSKDDWDGYGAKRVDEQSLKNALRFALTLPASVPEPKVDVIPSGEVVFTWEHGKRQLFSVIIGERNDLSYAGLYGATKAYGVEYYDEGIPESIIANVKRVYC